MVISEQYNKSIQVIISEKIHAIINIVIIKSNNSNKINIII